MLNFISKFFDSNEKQINRLKGSLAKINELEKDFERLGDDEIKARTQGLRQRLAINLEPLDGEAKLKALGSALDILLPEAFALVREAGKRTLRMRHFDVQLLAGIVLHQGKIAEQKTGEGKTLTATLPLYLNSLTGLGCHLVTPNDYLSRHGAGWMGPLYSVLGISVGVVIHEQAFIYDTEYLNETFLDEYSKRLRPVERSEAYRADVTYGTNNEFGFDYLRDNMVASVSQMVQVNRQGHLGSHHFAIVDEVDSILIDEARTPLIISAPAEESTQKYFEFAKLTERLTPKTDYVVDEKRKTVNLTELAIAKIEGWLGVENLYEKDFASIHHIEQALKAKALFTKDKDYVVKEGAVIIVDEFTGRLMFGRRYSEGLHQAIEAKEGVAIQRESKTLATVSFQNYFRLYGKLAGMTGTAVTEAEEFYKIYKLEVVAIPTHRPMIRHDFSDVIYKTQTAKYKAVVKEVEDCFRRGQPVLVGTTSIEKNELLHEYLERKGIPHQVLNAKQHEREALVIAQSGRKAAVTLATNMAGRGVDIILGGDPTVAKTPGVGVAPAGQTPGVNEEWQKEHDEVIALGGLHMVGSERHESRRIDNQLRGRSGRQGDPGSSKFFVSLQDDLMRIFGGETIEKLMDRFGLDENTPLENSLVSRSLEQAQKRVEGYNFDIRKHLVEYDDVMNSQREVIYLLRRKVLDQSVEARQWFLSKVDAWVAPTSDLNIKPESLPTGSRPSAVYEKAKEKFGEIWEAFVRQMSLQVIDTLWIEHLDNIDDLREGIGLRGYGGIDPLVEYKRESHLLFKRLVAEVYSTIAQRMVEAFTQASPVSSSEVTPVVRTSGLVYRHDAPVEGVSVSQASPAQTGQGPSLSSPAKVGRNDPCPCGSGKKFKKCHGK